MLPSTLPRGCADERGPVNRRVRTPAGGRTDSSTRGTTSMASAIAIRAGLHRPSSRTRPQRVRRSLIVVAASAVSIVAFAGASAADDSLSTQTPSPPTIASGLRSSVAILATNANCILIVRHHGQTAVVVCATCFEHRPTCADLQASVKRSSHTKRFCKIRAGITIRPTQPGLAADAAYSNSICAVPSLVGSLVPEGTKSPSSSA
jgi:hypothetical protein